MRLEASSAAEPESPAFVYRFTEGFFHDHYTILGDILDAAPETAPLFIEIGMHCLGCPSARSETVEQACYVHGQDVDALLAKLNAAIAGK